MAGWNETFCAHTLLAAASRIKSTSCVDVPRSRDSTAVGALREQATVCVAPPVN
jgi:hypothetical protein